MKGLAVTKQPLVCIMGKVLHFISICTSIRVSNSVFCVPYIFMELKLHFFRSLDGLNGNSYNTQWKCGKLLRPAGIV